MFVRPGNMAYNELNNRQEKFHQQIKIYSNHAMINQNIFADDVVNRKLIANSRRQLKWFQNTILLCCQVNEFVPEIR